MSSVPASYQRSAITALAKFFSFVFNPNTCQFLMFLYLRGTITWLLALCGFFFLFALPLLGYVAYVRWGLKRRNLYALERNKRYIPFWINIFSLFILLFLLRLSVFREPNTDYVSYFLVYVNALSFFITMFWRISIHMIAASASIVLIIFKTTGLDFNWENFLMFCVLAAIGWSRHYLKGHTLPQIFAGTFVGAIITAFFLLYLRFI